MGATSVTINSVAVSVHEPSGISIDDKQGGTSTASLTVIDTPSTTIVENQRIVITDSVEGIRFGGVIDTIEPRYITGSTMLLALTCKDKGYFANKRLYTGPEMSGRRAGDVVTQLHSDYLAAEGITANYALDHDRDLTTFGAGTQSGTAATASGLQLAPAGTSYSKKEDTTAEFAAGTLSNVVATNNTLQLVSSKAIKLSCSVTSSFSTNCYIYVRIYSFSGRVIAAGDQLWYDIWVSSDCPDIMGGIDLVCTDGTTARDNNMLDQYQYMSHPKENLATLANGKWFHREFGLPDALVGKTLSYASIAQEGDKDGDYSIWCKNITYRNSSDTVLNTIYGGASSINPTLLGRQGIDSWSCSVATTYETSGTRVSPAYQNTVCTILKQSLLSWEETATEGQIGIETSFDNGYTYQVATNHEAIPNLIAGMSVTNKYFKLRQTLKVNGPSPEVTPILKTCMFSIIPSYAATKNDVIDSDLAGDASMGTGSLTRLSNNASGLGITGVYRNWDDGTFDGTTGFTSIGGTVAGLSNTHKMFGVRTTGNGDGKARFDFAGQHQNFTLDMDIVKHNATGLYGVLYRTTGWQNANDTYCYFAGIQANSVVLGHGTNTSSGAGGWTQVAVNNAVTIETDKTYHMRLVVNGTSHKVYIDDVLEIDATDSYFTSTGYVGVRYYNPDAGVRLSAFFDNFGIVDNVTLAGGNRVWPSTSISAAGVLEGSRIQWNATVQDETALDIQASTDGGANYTSCTNGEAIPGCTAGTDVTGKSLLIKAIFTTQTAAQTPLLLGLSWFVASDYQSSGTRTSPALSLSSIGRVGSTSLAWVADVPTGTTLTGKTSTDNVTYTTVSSGDAISGITSMQDVQVDDFAINNAANWVSAFYSGGVAATWTWDTTNSRLTLAGGTNAVYTWTPSGFKDGKLTAIVYCSESGGLLARFSDAANHYRLRVHDSSAGTNPDNIILVRRVASVNTTLATWTLPGGITFARNSYHTVVWDIQAGVHTAWFDGVQVGTVTDATPLNQSGKVGLFTNGGTASWQQLGIQGYGDDVTGKSAYSRFVLTSSDPTQTPTISDLTLAARGSHLITGAVLPSTGFAYKKISDCIDGGAKQSNGWWNIDAAGELWLQNRLSQFAPWPLVSSDMLLSSAPRLVQSSPAYRNRQFVTGCYDTVTIVEQKAGNDIAQSWALSGKVMSISAMDINGQAATWGIADKDTGMDFYYTEGEVQLSQEKTSDPLAEGEILSITYTARVTYDAMAEDTAQQAILAARDGSTGIVEASEAAPEGTDKATGDAIAAARIAQNAVLTKQWGFATQRTGLKPGQWLSTFVPEYMLQDMDFLITGIKTSIKLAADGSSFVVYDVSTTNGPPLRSWTRYFINNFS